MSDSPIANVEEEAKSSPVKPTANIGKTKTLDPETINKAVEITSEKINKHLLKSVPRTAAGFESDFNSLKKDMPTFYTYVKNIPVETVQALFKNIEISAELFAAILRALSQFSLQSDEDLVHAAKLIVALGKASNFDMTLMFMDTLEKKDLVHIVQTLKKNADKLDSEVVKQIDSIYKL